MEKKIKEIVEYFKEKLLKKDFQILDITEYNAYIVVDNIYKFSIWIANSPTDCKLYKSEYNFIDIELVNHERELLHSFFAEEKIIKVREIKQAKVEQLLKELNEEVSK